MKNVPNYSIWQIVFLVPILVINLNRSRPVDAAHAQNSALFRLIVSVVCTVGLITVLVLQLKAAKKAREQAADAAELAPDIAATPDKEK